MTHYDWAVFKAYVDSKNMLVQYTETDVKYNVFAHDGPIEYETEIFKSVDHLIAYPTTWSDDLSEFENSYKPNANKPEVLRSSDGKQYVIASSRPDGTETWFTTCGDDLSGSVIGGGQRMDWYFGDTHDESTGSVIAPSGYKRKRFELCFIDPIYIKEGTLYYFNTLRGSYGDVYIVCPEGEVYLNNAGSPILAGSDTIVQHYVNKHPMQGDVPMGDELNTEETQVNALQTNYKLRVDITVPDTDNSSNGCVELETYRTRSVIL